MTLAELFELFIKSGLYLRNWSPRTAHTYRQGFTSFRQSLREQDNLDCTSVNDKAQCAVSKAQLEAWVISLRQRGLMPGGCNMYIRTINSFLSWLHAEGHIPAALRLKLLSNPPKAIKTFSEGDIRLLLAFRAKRSYDARTWVLTLLLMDTGLRIDEALGLERGKVDLDQLSMVVRGKGNKERAVPFSLEFRKHLFRHLSKTSGRFVFSTRSGQRLTYRNAYRDIKRLFEKLGIDGSHVHPHAFRHFFAVTYLRRTNDLYRLSRILGHTSTQTTTLYLRSMTAEQVAEGHSPPLMRTG